MGINHSGRTTIMYIIVGRLVMKNLFEYTKRLSEQIAYYDAIAKGEFFESRFTNPFTQPVNITIIWIDGDEEDF